MRTGAAYIRVSTEDQLEFSPDSQKKKIAEYAAEHGIVVPEQYVFVDEGISGRYAKKRPAFLRMIGMAKCRPAPFAVIFVWKFSRFARNRQESIIYKSMLRRECGIDVISVTEPLSDDPTAILIEALLEAMDEYYSINLAQEVRRGMNEKFSRGGVVSAPPFGYRMGEKQFEIEKEQAVIVRMVYAEFLQGKSLRAIAAHLNTLGACTKRGNPFASRTVEYILTNPVYVGKQRRRLQVKKGKTDNGPETVVAAAHEALVSEEEFRKAGERLARMRRTQGKRIRPEKSTVMLGGLVRCSCCGATLTQTVKGRTFQCHRYAKGQCGESHSVSIEKLNEAVLKQIEKDWGETGIVYACGVKTGQDKKPDGWKALLAGEQKRLERICAAYESGADTLEEYSRKKTVCQKRIRELKESGAEEAEKKRNVSPGNPPDTVRKLMHLFRTEELAEEEKNRILRSFIAEIIFDRKESSITIRYDW